MGKDTKPSQAKLEEVIQKTCEWVVPNDFNNSIESANSGVPIQKLAPDSPVSKSLMYLAANLVGDKVSVRPSFFARLFG